jgi:hypothetical protein
MRYSGGLEITVPIVTGAEPNVGAFANADILGMEQGSPFSAAKYIMKRYYMQLVLTRHQILLNSGKEQVISLVNSRRENGMITLFDKMGDDAINSDDNTTPLQLQGLLQLVDSTSVAGGINPTDLALWASTEVGGADVTMTLSLLQSRFGDVTVGADQPTLLLVTQVLFNKLWDLLQASQRFVDEKLASAGFAHLGFNQRPVVVDPSLPAKTAVWVNEKYLELIVHQDDDFTTQFIPILPNQDASAYRITWSGALTTNNRRMHAKQTNFIP